VLDLLRVLEGIDLCTPTDPDPTHRTDPEYGDG
jgi:hypothetical protein